jgi:hypothetical protein
LQLIHIPNYMNITYLDGTCETSVGWSYTVHLAYTSTIINQIRKCFDFYVNGFEDRGMCSHFLHA